MEEKKERIPIRRGWVLLFSGILESAIFLGLYYPLSLVLPNALGVTVGAIGTIICGFLLAYSWWAPRNLFFTFVPEGKAKIVVRGDAFKKVLMQWEGRSLAGSLPPPGTAIGDVVDSPARKTWFGGLKFYGLWPLDDIYLYSFSWTSIADNGTLQPHVRELLDYIIVKDDVYWGRVATAEDKNLLPLDVELIFTIKVVNPFKALFRVQSWLETVINRTEPAVRNIITEDTYESWITTTADLADRVLTALQTGEENLLQGFKDRYGVEVRAIEIREINPGEDYRAATLRKYLAEKEREKTIIDADAERQRLEKVATGEARRISKIYRQIEKLGDLGKLIRTLEALETSPGQGAKWIMVPGMSDIIAQVFPGKSPNSLGADEIGQIRQLLQQFLEQAQSGASQGENQQ